MNHFFSGHSVRRLGIAVFVSVSALFALPLNAQQVLRAGVNPTGGALSTYDAQTRKAVGLSVDLMTAIAQDAGFRVEFVPITLADLIPSLNARSIDIIAANLVATAERRAVIDFSEGFYVSHEALAVRKDDAKAYRSLADLGDATVGVQKGSVQQSAVEKAGLAANLRIYESMPDVLRAIDDGAIAAGLVGATVARTQLEKGLLPRVQVVDSYKPVLSSTVGFGVRKGDAELLEKLNASLARLRQDGTISRLFSKNGL